MRTVSTSPYKTANLPLNKTAKKNLITLKILNHDENLNHNGVVVKTSSQFHSYKFYERHLRGFDPFDGPMCIESTRASDSAV